jgi:hypothetical protein
MGTSDRLHLGHGGFLPHQGGEPFLLEGALDSADAVGPLGMAQRGLMIERSRVAKEQGGHEA